jgi:hypothetical protein
MVRQCQGCHLQVCLLYVLKIGWISEFFLVIDNNQLPRFDEARLLEVVFFFILFPLLLCFLSFNVTNFIFIFAVYFIIFSCKTPRYKY